MMPQPGLVGAAIDRASTEPMNRTGQRFYPVGDAPAPQQSRLPVRSVPRNGGRPNVARPVNVASKSRLLPDSNEKAIQLARRAIGKALDDGGDGVMGVAVAGQGITIDLSHNNLYSLPDEAIDIINQNIERLAMSHNRMSVLPQHISLCTSLRYLNVRSNEIQVFPSVLYDLECLEILDLSRNRLQALPDDMAKMSSLKVLAVEKNAIADLPICIAEMTALLALKIEGNPLKPMLRRIVDAHMFGSMPTPKSIRGNEDTDVAVTYQIKQFLRNEARSFKDRAASEKSLGSGEDTDTSQQQHSSKRSRGGRFPIKVHSDDDQPSRPTNVLAKSHSKAFSLHNHSLWSAGTIPLALDEREHSQQMPEGWKGHVQNVHSQVLRPGATLNKRYGVQQLPGLPTNDRFSQHLRGLSLSAAISPTQLPESEEQTRGVPEELVDVVPIFRSDTQHDPLLDMARTVYFTIHRPHWLVQALSSLTSDGSQKRSSLEMVVYNADFHLHELGRQIQNYAAQSHDRINAMNQVQRACAVLIKAYIPICSQISRSVDMLVERADARFVHHFLYMLYSSIMGLRAEFLRSMQEPGNFDRTIKPRRRIEPDRVPSPRESPMTPPPSASRSTHEALDQLRFAVSRLCRLIPETLPAINQRFLITVDYMTAQDSAPHIIETWQSAADASSKVMELSEALANSLASTKTKALGVSLGDLCYRFIDAWAAFGNILKSSKSQFGLEPDLRKRLQQIQQAVKEVMNRLVAMSPPTTATIPILAQPSSPSPFVPLTPRQGSLGPAIKASLSFSP